MSSEAAPRLEAPRAPDVAAPAPSGRAPQVLLALTHDESLIGLIADTCEGQEFIIVDSEADLADELVRRQPGAVLIDGEAVSQPIDALVRRLHAQFPDVGLVATGSPDDQAALSAEITHGVVHRFLHRPFSAERVQRFIESAHRRNAEERERGVARAPDAGAAPAPATPGPSRNVLAGAAALVLVAALGLWLAFRSPGTPQPAPAAAPASAAVTTLLERADEALARGNLATPGGAASLYASVLKQDASNVRARDGLGHVVDRLLTGAERALVNRRDDDAMRLIESARSILPDHPRVAFLLAQVARERERAATAEARDIRANVAEMLDLARQRMRSGALDAPERDNARFYVEAARVLAPADPAVKSAQRELAERLAEAASRARPVADGAKPAATLAAAATAPAPAAPEPQMPAPLPADAAHQATPTPTTPQAGPDVVAAGTLARVRYVEPVYPRTARVRGAGGWVEMQFTVRPDGTVGDVVVTQAEPAGVFDDAAAAAVRQWRYRPVLRDGQAVEQRARVRVRFAVE